MSRCAALIFSQRTFSNVYDPDILKCSGHSLSPGPGWMGTAKLRQIHEHSVTHFEAYPDLTMLKNSGPGPWMQPLPLSPRAD